MKKQKITTQKYGIIELGYEGDKLIGIAIWRFAYSKLTGFIFL